MGFFSKLATKKLDAYQRELIDIHYNEVDNMYRTMRGWRHDYRGHIQTLKALADRGAISEIQQYLDMLDVDLKTVDTVVKTGDNMTDAILNSKLSLARSKNINIVADTGVSVALTMSPTDLCVVIGNLLDNAIEATQKLPEERRMIRTYIDMKNRSLYLSVTNTTAAGKLSKINGIFSSLKGEGHGFGLIRVDDIVERYGGYISRNSEDGAFTTEVLIPQ